MFIKELTKSNYVTLNYVLLRKMTQRHMQFQHSAVCPVGGKTRTKTDSVRTGCRCVYTDSRHQLLLCRAERHAIGNTGTPADCAIYTNWRLNWAIQVQLRSVHTVRAHSATVVHRTRVRPHKDINDLPVMRPFVRFVRTEHTPWTWNDPPLKICRHRYIQRPNLVLRDVMWRTKGYDSSVGTVTVSKGATSGTSRPALLLDSLPGVNRPGREADHSPQFNAEVKNEWRYTSTPPTCTYISLPTSCTMFTATCFDRIFWPSSRCALAVPEHRIGRFSLNRGKHVMATDVRIRNITFSAFNTYRC